MNIHHSHHPFHLVNFRPWPITGSIGVLTLTSGIIKWFNQYSLDLLIIGISIVILTIIQWWRDIARESTFQGLHTNQVIKGLKIGIILFIVSEILFFFSFFWAFFHNSLSPNIEIGINWPPNNIKPFNPIQIPLLNSVILLSSGASVTWAHHRLINNIHQKCFNRLLITIILGILFTALQTYEYIEAPFTIADSCFRSVFFITTGFHGIHVIIGTTFLAVCLMRHIKNQFSSTHHLGFEAAAWYWHFVDVVWLFLFSSVYWWGR